MVSTVAAQGAASQAKRLQWPERISASRALHRFPFPMLANGTRPGHFISCEEAAGRHLTISTRTSERPGRQSVTSLTFWHNSHTQPRSGAAKGLTRDVLLGILPPRAPCCDSDTGRFLTLRESDELLLLSNGPRIQRPAATGWSGRPPAAIAAARRPARFSTASRICPCLLEHGVLHALFLNTSFPPLLLLDLRELRLVVAADALRWRHQRVPGGMVGLVLAVHRWLARSDHTESPRFVPTVGTAWGQWWGQRRPLLLKEIDHPSSLPPTVPQNQHFYMTDISLATARIFLTSL